MTSVRLYSTTSIEEQWQAVVGPWLRERATTVWQDARPTVVLTPSRAESFYLRSRLVAEGKPYLGLRFWTPSDARKFLLAESGLEVIAATKAESRLLTRACAEKVAARDKDNPSLTSVIREPGAFLRAYDLLLGAGWDPAKDGASYGSGLAKEFQRALKKEGVATQAGLHWELLQEFSARKEPLIANLLAVGFNGAHWPLWDLLKAMAVATENAVIALRAPHYFAEKVDELWIGSWEEVLKTTVEETSADAEIDESPFANLAKSYEQGAVEALDDADLAFRVTPDLASQVRAVVLQALDYLKRDDCARLGIVFPEANALAQEVAAELRRRNIPLDDGTGSWLPGLFETRCWQTWLALQEEPGVQRLIAWLRACEVQRVSNGASLSARRAADIVEGALSESLVDDLSYIASHLESCPDHADGLKVAEFLRRWIALPEKATFAQFLALTREAMTLPGWEDYIAHLRIDPPEWLIARKGDLPRRTFLEWLKETTVSQVRTRGAEGNHFYGKVHLLVYGQMGGQTWSHLILTGLNEGVWPRVFETGAFGSRHELMELNRRAGGLNVRGTTQGRFGEGHETVAPGKGYCLLPLERQDLSLRDLCAALEGTTSAVCLCALTTEGGRSLLPSDFFNHAYQMCAGKMLDEDAFRVMANTTAAWCAKHDALFESEKPTSTTELLPTKRAYEARRDESQPFGSFEFAYANPPAKPIQLTCRTWEEAWNHPATVWLERVVGATPWPEGLLSWPQTVGIWSHRWLAAALREFEPGKSTLVFPVLVSAAADRELGVVRARARDGGIKLYPWWEQVWNQARGMAVGLAETLRPSLEGQYFLPEFRLPEGLRVALPGSDHSDFDLKGRIDLLLVENGKDEADLARSDFRSGVCWVVDFKTGSAKQLNEKRIAEGKGIQAVLYALAARAMGATSVAMSLHTHDAVLTKQLSLDEIATDSPLFRALGKMHHDGILGMRADAESEYGFSPAYPLATRFVPKEILEAKWTLTHGGSMTEESE